ncbi:MAG: glycosyltransferase family 2 protein [Bacteroidales bacterium]|nr:glycosyltransferase family 2 protein [Bacteroidales bacterium]
MNPTADYQLTIIVPVYNEQEGLPALEERLAAYLPVCPVKACVLFVNDGSTDGSAARILEACTRHTDFFYLEFERNHGLSTALKAGFDFAESELCGYMDADLQTAPEDFDLLLPLIADHDMVTGIRTGRKDTAWKRFQSRFANGWRRMFTQDGAVDTGCPLKILRTEMARRLPMFRGMHRFLPALVLLEGGTYAQVPVRHFPRTAGESKYHLWNRLAGPFADCFAYRWMKKRHIDYRVTQTNLK